MGINFQNTVCCCFVGFCDDGLMNKITFHAKTASPFVSNNNMISKPKIIKISKCSTKTKKQ